MILQYLLILLVTLLIYFNYFTNEYLRPVTYQNFECAILYQLVRESESSDFNSENL